MNKIRTIIDSFRCDVTDFLLIISWSLCAISIPLVLGGWFTQWVMIPVFAIVIFLLVFGLTHRIIFFSRTYGALAIITIVFVLGIMFLRGFYTGDGPAYWLPFARSMVENHRIIPFIPTQDAATAREPLLPIFLSTGLFFGSSEWFYGWVPILFTIGTLLFIIRWLQSLGVSSVYRTWAVLIFLCTPLIAFWSWNILEEAPVLFFFTAFFFYADKFRQTHNDRDFVFLMLAFATALLTRYVSLILILPLLAVWFHSHKKQKIGILIIFYAPFILWIARNIAVYQSPFFPLFSSLFGGPYALYQSHSHFLGSLSMNFADKISFLLKNLSFELPIAALGIWSLIKQKRFDYLAIIIILLGVLSTFFFSQTSATRYFYPFIALLVVYGVWYLSSHNTVSPFLFFTLLLIMSLLDVSLIQTSSVFIGRIEHLFTAALPLLEYITTYKWLVAILLVSVLAAAKFNVEKYRLTIFALLVLHLVHLRFIENKSWIVTWPFIVLLIALILAMTQKTISEFIQHRMLAIMITIVLSLTWGLSVVYAVQNKGLSFNTVSRVYSTQDILAKEIDRREQGRRNFYILSEVPSHYVWNNHMPAITFRSFNFNYLTKLGIEQAHSAEDVRNVLQRANIKYLIYEGDENLPAYEHFDTGYINNHNTLYTISKNNPNLFPVVFSTTDTKTHITSVIYQIYQ